MTESDCVNRLAELDARGEVSRAIEHCESSPCCDNPTCQRYLGWANASRQDYEEAIKWYLKAASQGDEQAIEECWSCVSNIGTLGNKGKAIELCQTIPLSEHLKFQRYLVKAYYDQGNLAETLRWSLKIAERGAAEDLLYVGKLYLSEGKPQEAIGFLKRAASAGSIQAHQILGEMYGYGVGVPKDTKIATAHYQQSANNGYLLSSVRLLYLKRQEGGFAANLAFIAKFPVLAIKGVIMKFRDPNDPRVADILSKPK